MRTPNRAEPISQRMEGDSLLIVQQATEWRGFPASDSTLAFYERWNYNPDSALYYGTGFWFNEVTDYFKQRDSFGMIRHQGNARADKMATESIMVGLLLFETFLIGFLLRRGFKLIGQYSKLELGKESGDAPAVGYNKFLWLLTLIVFTLMSQVLVSASPITNAESIDAFFILRLFAYTFSYFILQNFLCKLIGSMFFSPVLLSKWETHNKTTLFVYAMALTPVLIGAEINLITNNNVLFFWTSGFLFLAKMWLYFNVLRIFSVKGRGYLYFILYLCALEILPILLFYKGLFLI